MKTGEVSLEEVIDLFKRKSHAEIHTRCEFPVYGSNGQIGLEPTKFNHSAGVIIGRVRDKLWNSVEILQR